MTKRILALIMVLAMAAGLVVVLSGCGNNDENDGVDATTALATTVAERAQAIYGAATPEQLVAAVEQAIANNDAEAFWALIASSQMDENHSMMFGFVRDEFVQDIAAEIGYMEMTFVGFEEMDEMDLLEAEMTMDILGLVAGGFRLALFDFYDAFVDATDYGVDLILAEIGGRWFLTPLV